MGGGRVRARPLRQANGTEALRRVREMRKTAPPHETILWAALRGRRLHGAKFRRQVWIGAYIADFACAEASLVVELDGSQHSDQARYDDERDRFLKEAGWRVLRFWNSDIDGNLPGVLEAIGAALLVPAPSPSPRSASGGPLPLPAGEGK